MNKSDKEILLSLARESIKYGLENVKMANLKNNKNLSPEVKIKAATFVTLTIKGELRGCIGKLLPTQPMYLDVIENAYYAAFEDTRFDPLSSDEFKKIEIEISILSKPQKLEFSGVEELLKILNNKKPGVILMNGDNQATFLPQVWESLQGPKTFLTELSLKAGLSPNDWMLNNTEFYTYSVDSFNE